MSRNSFEYLFWRGRALKQSIGSCGVGAIMGRRERQKIKKEIAKITKKLKIIAKKELKKEGIIKESFNRIL